MRMKTHRGLNFFFFNFFLSAVKENGARKDYLQSVHK